jgi:hypothetical protein
MRLLGFVMLVLCLAQTVLALPEGEWRSDFYGAIGTIVLDEDKFLFQLEEEGKTRGFEGPLAEVREPSGSAPGRLIVGPITGTDRPYEVVWYYPPEPPRARFLCGADGFPTLDAARACLEEFSVADSSVFLSRDYFQQIDQLPPLPEPSRDALVLLLQEALRRKMAGEVDTNMLMEALMVDRGHHPTRSRDPFEASLQKHIEDPEVSALLEELEK